MKKIFKLTVPKRHKKIEFVTGDGYHVPCGVFETISSDGYYMIPPAFEKYMIEKMSLYGFSSSEDEYEEDE